MVTTCGIDGDPETGEARAGIRAWLGLFLGISGGAVVIAVALGLVVLLTTAAAQAQPLHDAGAGQAGVPGAFNARGQGAGGAGNAGSASRWWCWPGIQAGSSRLGRGIGTAPPGQARPETV